MNSKANPDSHIYLYAKGWYKETDHLEDLKVIIGHRSGMDAKYISKADVFIVLSNIVWDLISIESGNPLYTFQKVISDMEKGKGFVDTFLSVIGLCKTEGLNIVKPDANILPLSDDAEGHIEDYNYKWFID